MIIRVLLLTLLMLFTPLTAQAKDKKTAPEECTLKNKFFCGEWQDFQGYYSNILGHKITSRNSRPSQYDCTIIDEFAYNKYPYSILKCTYYDDWDKKINTGYYMFYISDQTKEENIYPEKYEYISYIYSSTIIWLFEYYKSYESNDFHQSLSREKKNK